MTDYHRPVMLVLACCVLSVPMVLIGNLGGKLKTNRFLEFPRYGAKGHRTTGNCFLSLLDAVGDRREKFGAEDLDLKGIDTTGPLTEILG